MGLILYNNNFLMRQIVYVVRFLLSVKTDVNAQRKTSTFDKKAFFLRRVKRNREYIPFHRSVVDE